MKIGKLSQRLLMLARATADPNTLPGGQTILDSTFPGLVCDLKGVLYTRQVIGGSGGVTSGVPNTVVAFSNPGAGVTASASLPANALAKNVCQSIQAQLSDTAAVAGGTLVLRDGASGVGPILWSATLLVAINAFSRIEIAFPTNQGIPGSAVNTPMTLEFTAHSNATTFESVQITGYLAS